MSTHEDQIARDAADLEKFGYQQELNRGLGTFSSFAVAFSYISPSTGIFTLFFLGMSALGARLWWTWPTVALFQFIVALNFAEVTSHFPLAGSVFQWTKYLAGRGYAWITGWFYIFAGILTVASVCATLPIALIPALNNMFGWSLNDALGSADQKVIALITLALITILNIYGVRLVAIVNNTGVVFEILGMVVFAVFLAIVHNQNGVGVIFQSSQAGNYLQFPAATTVPVLPGGDVHVVVRDLRLRHRVDPRGGDAEPARRGAEGRARVRDRGVRDRGDLPVGCVDRGSRTSRTRRPGSRRRRERSSPTS